MKLHLIQIRCLTVVIGFLFCGNVFAQKDTLSLLHITDLHVLFDHQLFQADLAKTRDKKDLEAASFKNFINTIPEQLMADMVIATGDLLDSYEAESQNGDMLNTQVEQFAAISNKSQIPLYLTIGNHDLFSISWKDEALDVNQYNAEKARAAWIRHIPCFKNGTYYSNLFKVGNTTFRLIFLDNSYVKFASEDNITVPFIEKDQLYWLKAQLQESNEDVEIILMHLPFREAIDQLESSEFYSVFAANPSTKLILSGHQHKNKVFNLPGKTNKSLFQVQTGDLMRKTDNWRLIHLTENSIMVSLPGTTETELNISLKN